MIVPGETFPYTPLNPTDQRWITKLCGGNPEEGESIAPIEDVALLRNFMVTSGLSFLGEHLVRNFFNDMAWKSAVALDINPSERAAQSFNRGLLFYGGVVQEISKTPVLPYADPVLGKVGDADGRNIALDGYQIIQELPSFRELLTTARPAMETFSDELYQMAQAGAGMLHLTITESAALRYSIEPETLEAAHDELSDLRSQFDNWKNPEA